MTKGAWWAMAAILLVCVVLMAWASCAAAPPPQIARIVDRAVQPEKVDDAIRKDDLEHVYKQQLNIDQGADAGPFGLGRIRRLHGKTSCIPKGGVLPYITWTMAKPRPGQWIHLEGTTRACRDVAGNFPDDMVFLLLSFREQDGPPIDYTPFGMPGCMLLVNLQYVVAVPVRPPGYAPHTNARFACWRSRARGGVVDVVWLPGWPGEQLHLQLLVAAPGETPAGWLASHAVQVEVGDGQ